LEGIENLINLKYLNCEKNFLISLEGIEILIKLIKNNKKIKNDIIYTFIDSYDSYDSYDSADYIELKDLFDNLIKCKNNNKIDEYIEKIEQMIVELNGFQNYVLK
jgi:hypothetical protein